MDSARCTDAFRPLLAGFSEDALEWADGTIFGIDAQDRLAYLNPAYFRFAEANDGEPGISTRWGLGASVMEATPPVLRAAYRERFAACRGRAGSAEPPLQHEYECSSPSHLRRFAMTLYPLGRGEEILVVNSLRVEIPHPAAGARSATLATTDYANADEIVRQCAHCRRVENLRVAFRWDWVAEWVAQPPPTTSHVLCSTCLDHYYPRPSDESRG